MIYQPKIFFARIFKVSQFIRSHLTRSLFQFTVRYGIFFTLFFYLKFLFIILKLNYFFIFFLDHRRARRLAQRRNVKVRRVSSSVSLLAAARDQCQKTRCLFENEIHEFYAAN